MSSLLRSPTIRSSILRSIHLVSPTASVRSMSLASDFHKKEKVEEDRYIRQKEHELYLARKAKADAEAASRELSEVEVVAKKIHDDTVSEVFGVLSKTGDKVS
eukprot:255055_1